MRPRRPCLRCTRTRLGTVEASLTGRLRAKGPANAGDDGARQKIQPVLRIRHPDLMIRFRAIAMRRCREATRMLPVHQVKAAAWASSRRLAKVNARVGGGVVAKANTAMQIKIRLVPLIASRDPRMPGHPTLETGLPRQALRRVANPPPLPRLRIARPNMANAGRRGGCVVRERAERRQPLIPVI